MVTGPAARGAEGAAGGEGGDHVDGDRQDPWQLGSITTPRPASSERETGPALPTRGPPRPAVTHARQRGSETEGESSGWRSGRFAPARPFFDD